MIFTKLGYISVSKPALGGAFMVNLFRSFLHDESGATAIEYGLIAGLISVIIITVLTNIGTKLNAKFTSISHALN